MNAYLYITIMAGVIVLSASIAFFVSRTILKDNYSRIGDELEAKDMIEAENKINDFYRENRLTSGASLKQIAEVLKVREGGICRNLEDQAKLSSADMNGFRTVEYKERFASNEKKFIFTHECAHVINGDDTATRPSGYHKSTEEQYIDYMAASLLMPYAEVLRYLKNNNYNAASRKSRLKLIYGLCSLYGVSEVVALRRVNEVILLEKEGYLPK